MTKFEDTVQLDRKDWVATPTKDGATFTVNTGYDKVTFNVPLKEMAIMLQNSLQVKDMEQAREKKIEREPGNEKRYYGP